MIKIARGIYIHYFTFFIFLAAFLTGTFKVTLMAFLMAFCHELSHLLTALILKEKCRGIALMPYGLRLFMKMSENPLKELAIALSGPLLNIILCLIIRKGPLFDINFAMAFINLFPIMPLDGGRVSNALLSLLAGPFRASYIMNKLSLFGGVAFTIMGIIQAFMEGFNLSVFTIGVFLLFSAITDSGKERLYLSCLTKDDKLKKGGKRATFLAARKSLPARKILPLISPGKYVFVKVLDNEGGVIREITEEELKNSLLKKGAGLKLWEIT